MSIVAAFAVPHPPIILPEVGHGEEQKIGKTIEAYRLAMQRAAAFHPDTIVLSSPHATLYSDYFHISPGQKAAGNFKSFQAPQVEVQVNYDTEFVAELSKQCADEEFPAGTLGEREPFLDHATMIPLHFLNAYQTDYKLVRIGLSGLSPLAHYHLGQCIAATAARLNRRVVYIASGDLSHKLKEDGPYGFAPAGPEFDRQCTAALGSGDFLSLLRIDPALAENAAECGLRSFWIMAGALDRQALQGELLSYEGPFGVGYGVASFVTVGTDASRAIGEQFVQGEEQRLQMLRNGEDVFVQLARHSLETYVKTGAYAALPPDLPAALTQEKAGAFVSLQKDGQLRGCIGTILPAQRSLAEEILYNAVSAAVHDPRFEPVRSEELESLVYSVDVLTEPEPIDSEKQLNVKRYGVIVEAGGRRGVLLPDLPGVDTVGEQVSIARRKGGIRPAEPVQLWRFEVVRHH